MCWNIVPCREKNGVPKHVMQVFVELWLIHCGVPEIVVVDQEGEFESTFAHACESFGIETCA